MFATNEEDESRRLTHRPAVARRQLHASIGAVVVIALVALAAAVSLRTLPAPDQAATNATKASKIVKAAVRQTPSQRMQATDQSKGDRGS